MRTYAIDTLTLEEQPTVVRRATLAVPEISGWMGPTLGAVAAHLAAAAAGPAGPPFARFHRVGEGRFEVEAGFPALREVPGGGGVDASHLPSGTAAATWHVGPYDEMEGAYDAVVAWIRDHGGAPDGDPWEVYASDPAAEPDPARWRTRVVQPYRPV